ncbi:hypothetical protein [Reyranella sp.]|uniref:hypothetical protein n=1 Tax=Reyranella sp. TaxID=1929291 RepID=UPI001217BF8F|nr:hypothetical protein [Reyranella sp.]TAJ82428.1 MAG: hypothetical protein EPO50_26825 [Reyranella sp.]
MRKLSIAIVLGSVLVAAPFSAAMSQSNNPEYAVFVDRSGNKPLTASAKDTVRKAITASKSRAIQIQGRADYAEAVKNELVLQGVSPDRISVRPVVAKPLQKAGDGMSDPTDRKVVISF